MGNKIFTAVVLLLWGTTMTWLFTAKILPPFFHGEPPTKAAAILNEPAAWRVELNGRVCGFAVHQAIPGVIGSKEVHSRLRVKQVPLPTVAPVWMKNLLEQLGEIDLDLRTRTTLDTFDNLASFDTKIRLNDNPSAIRIRGATDNGVLKLSIQTGLFVRRFDYPWRAEQSLAGELTPNARLVGLRVGKRWRTEVYSVFGSPGDPLSMVEAEVVGREAILLDGELTPTHRVEYRQVMGAGVGANERLQNTVWVTDNGLVIRQESQFFNAKLRFERLPREEAAGLAQAELDLDNAPSQPVASTSSVAPSPPPSRRWQADRAAHD